MAKWQRVLVLAFGASGLVWASATCAAPQEATTAPAWSRINTLAGLPAEVSAYLVEHTGLADQGGDYNSSCVVDVSKPSTRFVLGAVNSDEAIVAVEHGGRGPGINTWLFRRENSQWKFQERGSVAWNVTLMTAKILVDQHQKSMRKQ